MAKRDYQVSVPLPADLREFVERQAAQQDRSVGVIGGPARCLGFIR
jgi:hypothetical protein